MYTQKKAVNYSKVLLASHIKKWSLKISTHMACKEKNKIYLMTIYMQPYKMVTNQIILIPWTEVYLGSH